MDFGISTVIQLIDSYEILFALQSSRHKIYQYLQIYRFECFINLNLGGYFGVGFAQKPTIFGCLPQRCLNPFIFTNKVQ